MIYLGSDHAGYETKEYIRKALEKKKIPYKDLSPKQKDGDDYPEHAKKVAKAVAKGTVEKKCPKCSKNLVLRSSIYGKFYGCSDYPKCKHIEKLENNEKQKI